jgi:hypothetical protein
MAQNVNIGYKSDNCSDFLKGSQCGLSEIHLHNNAWHMVAGLELLFPHHLMFGIFRNWQHKLMD